MGLDMYIYQTSEDNLIEDPTDVVDVKKLEEVWYWRKHPNLHGWFENLYREKGGKCEDFNCEYVTVAIEDINKLEQVLKENNLPITTGFFFGMSEHYRVKDYLKFIRKARKILKDDNCLIYSSFW